MKHDVQFYKFSATKNARLTSIITLRTVSHYDMIERLNYRLYDLTCPESIHFLVVDDGSRSEDSARLKSLCEQYQFDFLRIESSHDYFCAGRARNLGAAYAQTEYIVHEDIDLVPYTGYYQALIDEIDIQGLAQCSADFFSVPVVYLKEQATKEFFDTESQMRKNLFLNYLLEGRNEYFDFYMPASSVIVLNRYYYLSIGGYNEAFKSWGLEDLEYAYRLTRSAKKYHTPTDFKKLVTSPQFAHQYNYEGWRTQFRLHGESIGRKGIILFHAHHPIDRSWRNHAKHSNNKALFENCVSRFETEGHYLSPISDPYQGKSLIFGKGCFAYNRALLPHWGILDIKGYEHFEHINIKKYIEHNHIDRVIFTNPYANWNRTNIYNQIKEMGCPFYVVERGALRDSMFVDSTGFCSESSLYQEQYWDKPISVKDQQKVSDYIKDEINCSNSLEKQNERMGGQRLLNELMIPSSKKIIFVPLQSRSDTTTNYFAGDIGSFDNFINLIRELAQRINYDWQIVVKKHPLSNIKENINGVIFADDKNIKDLIEISDYVLLMNSGVGVMSLMWNKPVIYTATAFYASDRLNRKAVTASDVLEIIDSGFKPDFNDSIKFLSYLINDFYSFGTMQVYEKKYTNSANLTITDKVDYYQVNIDGKNLCRFDGDKQKVAYISPLYDTFRKDLDSKLSLKVKPVSGEKKPKPSTAIVTTLNTKPAAKIGNKTVIPLTQSFSLTINQPLLANIAGIHTLENILESSLVLRKKTLKLYRSPKLFFADFLRKRIY